MKCYIFDYFQANFAPESEVAGTKFNTRTGRPDWAIQSSITPVKANRPPPPELKPSAQSLGNARGIRDPPGACSNIYDWFMRTFARLEGFSESWYSSPGLDSTLYCQPISTKFSPEFWK